MERNWTSLKSPFNFTIIGILIALIVLHPFTMIIYWFEFNPHETVNLSLFEFLLKRMEEAFTGKMLFMTFSFSILGGCLGLFFHAYHSMLINKRTTISRLTRELEKSLTFLIKEGESETLEFKSSARWDFRQKKANKALEPAIVKTIAGFMNNKGGTLLIGIDDLSQPVGLEQDFSTLKKKDRDGYEQFIMGLVSFKLGSDISSKIKIVFHKLEDKEICRIIIESSSRPVYYRESNNVQFFLRAGGGTRELNVQEATEYTTHRWPKR